MRKNKKKLRAQRKFAQGVYIRPQSQASTSTSTPVAHASHRAVNAPGPVILNSCSARDILTRMSLGKAHPHDNWEPVISIKYDIGTTALESTQKKKIKEKKTLKTSTMKKKYEMRNRSKSLAPNYNDARRVSVSDSGEDTPLSYFTRDFAKSLSTSDVKSAVTKEPTNTIAITKSKSTISIPISETTTASCGEVTTAAVVMKNCSSNQSNTKENLNKIKSLSGKLEDSTKSIVVANPQPEPMVKLRVRSRTPTLTGEKVHPNCMVFNIDMSICPKTTDTDNKNNQEINNMPPPPPPPPLPPPSPLVVPLPPPPPPQPLLMTLRQRVSKYKDPAFLFDNISDTSVTCPSRCDSLSLDPDYRASISSTCSSEDVILVSRKNRKRKVNKNQAGPSPKKAKRVGVKIPKVCNKTATLNQDFESVLNASRIDQISILGNSSTVLDEDSNSINPLLRNLSSTQTAAWVENHHWTGNSNKPTAKDNNGNSQLNMLNIPEKKKITSPCKNIQNCGNIGIVQSQNNTNESCSSQNIPAFTAPVSRSIARVCSSESTPNTSTAQVSDQSAPITSCSQTVPSSSAAQNDYNHTVAITPEYTPEHYNQETRSTSNAPTYNGELTPNTSYVPGYYNNPIPGTSKGTGGARDYCYFKIPPFPKRFIERNSNICPTRSVKNLYELLNLQLNENNSICNKCKRCQLISLYLKVVSELPVSKADELDILDESNDVYEFHSEDEGLKILGRGRDRVCNVLTTNRFPIWLSNLQMTLKRSMFLDENKLGTLKRNIHFESDDDTDSTVNKVIMRIEYLERCISEDKKEELREQNLKRSKKNGSLTKRMRKGGKRLVGPRPRQSRQANLTRKEKTITAAPALTSALRSTALPTVNPIRSLSPPPTLPSTPETNRDFAQGLETSCSSSCVPIVVLTPLEEMRLIKHISPPGSKINLLNDTVILPVRTGRKALTGMQLRRHNTSDRFLTLRERPKLKRKILRDVYRFNERRFNTLSESDALSDTGSLLSLDLDLMPALITRAIDTSNTMPLNIDQIPAAASNISLDSRISTPLNRDQVASPTKLPIYARSAMFNCDQAPTVVPMIPIGSGNTTPLNHNQIPGVLTSTPIDAGNITALNRDNGPAAATKDPITDARNMIIFNSGRFLAATSKSPIDAGNSTPVNRGGVPAPATKIPLNGEKTLVNRGQVSAAATEVPTVGEKTPVNRGLVPAPATTVPTNREKTPVDRVRVPAPATKAPTDGEKTPLNRGRVLAPATKAPTDGKKTPVNRGRVPARATKAPTDGDNTPINGSRVPATETKKPPDIPRRPRKRGRDYIHPIYVAITLASLGPQLPTVSRLRVPINEMLTYRPTIDEFKDPVSYLEKIEKEASKFGICKIIPPESYDIPCYLEENGLFTTMNQYLGRFYHRWGPSSRELTTIQAYVTLLASGRDRELVTRPPLFDGVELDLVKLYHLVLENGGIEKLLADKEKWARIAEQMCLVSHRGKPDHKKLEKMYCKHVLPYESLSYFDRTTIQGNIDKVWKERSNSALRRANGPLNYQRRLLGDNISEDEEEIQSNSEIDEVREISKPYFERVEECTGKGRTMNLATFRRIAAQIEKMHFKNGPTPTALDIEDEYWNIISLGNEHVCVQSASIDTSVDGLGHTANPAEPGGSHPWNLKRLSDNPLNILRSLGKSLSVTVPTLSLNQIYSTNCWHMDPHKLAWMDYMHEGPSKIWYAVSAAGSSKLRKAMEMLIPYAVQNKGIWLTSDTIMVPPGLLLNLGVDLQKVEQKVGEFIVVFPGAYASSIATGMTISESIYFENRKWLSNINDTFQQMRRDCEPGMFSNTLLLMRMARDPDILPALLPNVLTSFKSQVFDEMQARREINKRNYPVTLNRNGRVDENLGPISWPNQEECSICREPLILSKMLVYKDSRSLMCLKHGLRVYATESKEDRRDPPFTTYHYSSSELQTLVVNLEQRVLSVSMPNSEGVRARSDVERPCWILPPIQRV